MAFWKSNPPPPLEIPPLDVVRHYHEATKHHFHRYARSAGYLDWDTQPHPFRRFEGAEELLLPFAAEDSTPPYGAILRGDPIPPRPVDRATIAQLFELSLGLSAWKEIPGSRWALRVNPSSGNLHPTEGYLVTGGAFDGTPLVAHYAPDRHAFEVRARFGEAEWNALADGFPRDSFLVGLASIHWREAWKYGERAFRYCQHDAGHALACLRLSAAALGWNLVHLSGLGDREVAALLGLDREDGRHPNESEHPDLVAVVFPGPMPASCPRTFAPEAIHAITGSDWTGTANQLSADHVDWAIIDAVAEAAEKPRTEPRPMLAQTSTPGMDQEFPALPLDDLPARTLFLQRRSAVAYDGRTGISREAFYRMMLSVYPRALGSGAARAPFDAVDWEPSIHLGLFVHRVEGIPPGLYVLARRPEAVDALKSAMRADFQWTQPEGCPAGLPLFLLLEGDARAMASQVSCHQDIAGGGAFSMGMISEFSDSLERHGAWFYRNLFWETGMIGQVLYLEAEAAGIRATGIGCFFDDPVHQLFGLSDRKFQSLYHFTVGGPVDDERLSTLPPYTPEMIGDPERQ